MKSSAALVDRIDALLPQTQCTRCAYPGCRPYAEVIAAGTAPINRCAPGGVATIAALAALLDMPSPPPDPAFGTAGPLTQARIDEAACIGCTLCIQACPVDAIVGAAKLMHTVVADLCSGCDLCLAPCPVDCIDMVPAKGRDAVWDPARADAARARFEHRAFRLARERKERAERLSRRALRTKRSDPAAERKRAIIAAAIERARAKRAAGGSGR